jgi:hypothetical protein
MTATEQMEHIGDTRAIADHDHDLIHELSKRLDGVWRYDQYIANAEDRPELQDFWRSLKKQDQQNVTRLKELVKNELDKGCF